MIIECNRCYARYRYDEARFEGKPSKKVRCTKCLAIFEVFRPDAGDAASAETAAPAPLQPDDTMTRGAEEGKKPAETTRKSRLSTDAHRRLSTEFKLPEDAKLSLAVISGPQAGKIFPIEKPRVVIGRQDADINVEDPEVSRHHAAVEVLGQKVTLLDLESTNGTFVEDAQITEMELENQGEFTVGGSTLMLIITPR